MFPPVAAGAFCFGPVISPGREMRRRSCVSVFWNVAACASFSAIVPRVFARAASVASRRGEREFDFLTDRIDGVLLGKVAELGRGFLVFITIACGLLMKERRRFCIAAEIGLSLEKVPNDDTQELFGDFRVLVPKGQRSVSASPFRGLRPAAS